MHCYDFELNISAYIDGDLKQNNRKDFVEHMTNCYQCKEKLTNIRDLISSMPKMANLATSDEFLYNLNQKIEKNENQGPKFIERMKRFRLLGFEPIPSLGFAMAIIMIISGSYFIINQDRLPIIDMDKLSNQSQNTIQKELKPLIINSNKNESSLADSDSSIKLKKRIPNNKRIKLVGGN
tara:strand:- start:22 stop:561 length:540 start_codon:yes stop_codon:yes gene_type:complete